MKFPLQALLASFLELRGDGTYTRDFGRFDYGSIPASHMFLSAFQQMENFLR